MDTQTFLSSVTCVRGPTMRCCATRVPHPLKGPSAACHTCRGSSCLSKGVVLEGVYWEKLNRGVSKPGCFWEVPNGVGVDGVVSDFPFFYAFFPFFYAFFPFFHAFFPLLLRFSLLLLKDKGKQQQFTAKMGNFTPTPSAPTPCKTSRVSNFFRERSRLCRGPFRDCSS